MTTLLIQFVFTIYEFIRSKLDKVTIQDRFYNCNRHEEERGEERKGAREN